LGRRKHEKALFRVICVIVKDHGGSEYSKSRHDIWLVIYPSKLF
jgi:hypothetical protein